MILYELKRELQICRKKNKITPRGEGVENRTERGINWDEGGIEKDL